MATVYVICAEKDTSIIESRVLRHLPSYGYSYWLARHHFAGTELSDDAIERAMDQCQAILVVLSLAFLESSESTGEIDIALASQRTVIVVQLAFLGEEDEAKLPTRLWTLPKIDFTLEEQQEVERLLVSLLPPINSAQEMIGPNGAKRIEWNEEIFSTAIAEATSRHDHAQAVALVVTIVNHLSHRPYAYPPKYAYSDLQKLRQEREFELMRQYGEKVIETGTREDRVRRLYAQALIETGKYDSALKELQLNIADPATSKEENFEARGLIGRTYKQLYVNEPDAVGAAELLKKAIAAYESAYLENQKNYWHGVNAASCLLRAERDGIEVEPLSRAKQIAAQIVEDLKGRELPVWDCASLVEALLALEQYKEAQDALEVYIHHPDMTAFEVSSTYRQYHQVLQLDRVPSGKAILLRLRNAMERYRTGSVVFHSVTAPNLVGEAMLTKHLVIRLGEPNWQPQNVTDIVIRTRLGQIVTARGSESSIRELLNDSKVISVEESRPAAQIECDRSVPFIKVTGSYTGVTGTYDELGDQALIAIIDNGIDVLHEAFLDADGKSRIVGIWDQTALGGMSPHGFDYGVFHDESAIAGYIISGTVPQSLGRNDRGHGTHVASIAGGRAAGNFKGGVAPDAKLLIVVSASDGPIGYSQSYIEALHFIDGFATRQNLPVVVNVSQGMNAGAHDGKSTLEVAFDAFSESGRKPNRVVVKSAGNERAKGGHAKITLMTNSLEQLCWRRESGADFAERIELWWSSADEIKFRLRQPLPAGQQPPDPDPPQNWSAWVSTLAPEQNGKFPSGGPFRLTFTKRHIDNGDSLLLIELGDLTAAAAKGDWLLDIWGISINEGGEVHGWIERSQGLPTTFVNHASEEMTLSIPGTAVSVITVGAVDSCQPIKVGGFSSYGPTRDKQNKPLICAPGVNVRAAEGGTADDVFSDSGTSMASPHVAGAIALLLSRAAKSGKILSGNQITSALRQKTQNYNGNWDRGQGYGVIDVSALLAAFD